MTHDGKLNIATGASVNTKIWKNKQTSWSEIVQKLSEENRTNETRKEFMSFSKPDQMRTKDVGGYVGGYLNNGRRNPENVMHRQLLTLDIDFAHLDFWCDFTLLCDNAAVLHATHKHCEASPRYRLVMPLSREATPDEYVAVGRKLAGELGIDLFDNTTFETNRLMFWPSNPKDVDYYFEYQDGEWLDVDKWLASYVDWRDSSAWPTAEKKISEVNTAVKKQEDPELKKGIVGAFCRAYSIEQAIETFLSDKYEPTQDGRYTYILGTAASGLVVYDGKFAFSHHGTDPCSGKLCNAFDLVRIHKFGFEDIDSTSKAKPSFKLMQEFARNDKGVKAIIADESINSANYDFTEPDPAEPQQETKDPEDLSWMQELEVDAKSGYASSAKNLSLIFANDFRLKDAFKRNDFDNKICAYRNLPWRKVENPEPVRNVDFAGVRNYIEVIYGITGKLKIEDAFELEVEKNHHHPVRDYLAGLKWDGTPRLEKIFIEYLGAKDSQYTRQAARKMMAGAVSRVLHPGVKFDLVVTFVGAQGSNKSTFVQKIGREWSSDSFTTVQGKEAYEQLQGAWIIEAAELAGMKKAELENTKHYLTKCEDSFRPAYGRVVESYKRQCIFVATTDNPTFLRDPSGNRRFLPIDIDATDATKDVHTDLDKEIDQIWAEAVQMVRDGEKLYLDKDVERFAKIEQKLHSEADERVGIIENYLHQKVPAHWAEMDIFDRRQFMSDDKLTPEGDLDREFVCVAEVWCECLGKERNDMDRWKTREVNDILRSLDGWEAKKSTKNFPLYGRQKYYERIK